jgi:hypothetical protein
MDTGPTLLERGSACADYELVEVLDDGAAPGDYTMITDGPMGSVATLFRAGVEVASVPYDWRATVGPADSRMAYLFSFAGFFELVVARTGTEPGDLATVGQCLFGPDAVWRVEGIPYVIGENYAAFEIVEIVDLGAPPGEYTILAEAPDGFTAQLRRDAIAVNTVRYEWRTTIGAEDLDYTFTFPGYFDVVVRNALTGTHNLYGIDEMFDGRHTWTVPP